MERKKARQEILLISIIKQFFNRQSDRIDVLLLLLQCTSPLYHIVCRLSWQKRALKMIDLKTGIGKIQGKNCFTANKSEILFNFYQLFLFILWVMNIQGVEGCARSQSFTNSNLSIFANLHKDSSRSAIWPALMYRYMYTSLQSVTSPIGQLDASSVWY